MFQDNLVKIVCPLSYLEPFFKEMTPPVYSLQNDIQRDALMNQFHTAEIEITTIIELSPEFQFLKYSSSGDHIISDYIRQYAWLRHLGFNEIADTFIDNLLINPGFSTYFLETAYNLLVHPIIDPFHANPSFSMQDLAKMNEIGFDVQISGKKNYLPEVGSFLLKKTTYYPESLDACKNIIARYDENDLYEVYSALNTSISSRNPEGILKNKSEVALILDNVWSDTELIESNVSAYKFGIGVTCGVVGMSIGGLAGGLLGSIGISALNQTKSSYLDQFSELIAKSVASPYLTTIYDFKKKYHIPE